MNRRTFPLRFRGGLALLALGAITAASSPAAESPKNQARADRPSSHSDVSFVQQAASANAKELTLAELAVEKTENERVRQYAQQIIEDHEQSSKRLRQLADEQGIALNLSRSDQKPEPIGPQTVPPDDDLLVTKEDVTAPAEPLPDAKGASGQGGLDGVTSEDYRELAAAQGEQFDERFVTMMTKSHEEVVQRFEQASEDAESSAVRSFASQQLPTLRQHLERAQELQTAVAE